MLLFGGVDLASNPFGDSWLWDGTRWTLAATPSAPTARAHAALAPDGSGLLLFGGFDASGPRDDSWLWNGSGWTQLAPPSAPPARVFHAMAAEPGGSVVLFGGIDGSFALLGDTWRWNGAAWQQLQPASAPAPRQYHAMALDRGRADVVLFGGSDGSQALADTWTWDTNTWTQRAPVHQPAARQYAALAYADERDELLLAGGLDANFLPLADTWAFAGTDWTPRPAVHPLEPRYAAALANDPLRGETVLFGGSDLNLAWPMPLAFRSTPNAGYPPFGSGCAGAAGVPDLHAQGASRPWIGDQFRFTIDRLPPAPGPLVILFGYDVTTWNGNPLPQDLAAYGMAGCSALQSIDGSLLLFHGGGSATYSLTVPFGTNLIGMLFSNQIVVVDATAGNALGATISNACRGLVAML
jgi:hypothetical protein